MASVYLFHVTDLGGTITHPDPDADQAQPRAKVHVTWYLIAVGVIASRLYRWGLRTVEGYASAIIGCIRPNTAFVVLPEPVGPVTVRLHAPGNGSFHCLVVILAIPRAQFSARLFVEADEHHRDSP